VKKDIHPNWEETTISCACGNVIKTHSTKKNLKVEICSACHPFYTGQNKRVDTGGRVGAFNRRFNRTTEGK
jgi:large subunit ribosomal protein L31